MSYFKRLTESRRLEQVSEARQLISSSMVEEDYSADTEELPFEQGIAQPYKPFKKHNHERMFRRQRLLLASTFKQRMQTLERMVVPQAPSTFSERYIKFEHEHSKYSRQERSGREAHMLSHASNSRIAPQPRVVYSQNNSPIKEMQQQEEVPSSMQNSMKMSEQFFTHFLKLMEKVVDERKEKPSETKPSIPSLHHGCECHYEPHRLAATTHLFSTTPTHHPNLGGLHSPYVFREYSAQQPQNDYAKQPPIIINNIIKPDDRRSHWNDHLEDDSFSRRDRSTIDEKLEQQELMIKKLQNNRRENSSFNQTAKLNLTSKHSMSNGMESHQESSRPTTLGKTAPLSKQLTFPIRDTSITCIEDDNSSENELIRSLKREEEKESHRYKQQIATNDTSQQDIQPETTYKKRPRQFQMLRRESGVAQQPPIPPSSSNRNKKPGNNEPSITNPELSVHTPESYEIKPPVSFDFPMSSLPAPELTLAQAFQMRRGDILSRQKSKRDKSKPEKTKQELAQLRKDMMKRRPKEQPLLSQKNIQICSEKQSRILRDTSNTSSCKRQPSRELMDRLIGGVKAKIDQREMKALTTKNYNDLPQVKQKKDQQRRREQFARRMQAKKEFERTLRARR